MKKLAILPMVALLAASCSSQENKNPEVAQNNDIHSKTPLKEEPKGTWKVDKEVDENGNIVKYDSIYSWSSNDSLQNFSKEDMDSIMHNFSSVFGEDFLDDEFGKHFSNIDDILTRMDMMRQQFMQEKPLIPAEPETSDSDEKL